MKLLIFGYQDQQINTFMHAIRHQVSFIDITSDIEEVRMKTIDTFYDLIIFDSKMIHQLADKEMISLKVQIKNHMKLYIYIRNSDLVHMKRYIRCYHDGMIFEHYTKKRMQDIFLSISNHAPNLQKRMLSKLFVEIITLRDIETSAHIEKVAHYSTLISMGLRELGLYDFLSDRFIDDLYFAAHFHDIGKIGIPDEILFKPGKFTSEEFEQMKKHSLYGDQIFKKLVDHHQKNRYIIMAKIIALHHHEKWDGSGYPSKLKGKEIPLIARIVALADVYDALCSVRSYKEAFSHEKAKAIIVNDKGKHFDPDVVDAFLLMEQYFIKYNQSHTSK